MRKMKKAVIAACTPPSPADRERFLAALPYPRLGWAGFLLAQAGYIRKRVWLSAAAILLAGTGAIRLSPAGGMAPVWLLSALIPQLAMLTAAEISRSDVFGMAEVESACRFNLPCLTGARLLVLGGGSFSAIAAASVLSGSFASCGIARAALYILAPYLAVNGISLAIFSRFSGQEGSYLSAAAALGVSLLGATCFGYAQALCRLYLIALLLGALLGAYYIPHIWTRKGISYAAEH